MFYVLLHRSLIFNIIIIIRLKYCLRAYRCLSVLAAKSLATCPLHSFTGLFFNVQQCVKLTFYSNYEHFSPISVTLLFIYFK
ncbi:hypothetical protein VIGAN_08069400, partial [Vigna angularis var. angularis]